MKVSRRKFIQACGSATVAAGLLSNVPGLFAQAVQDDGLFPVPVMSTNDALTYLSSAHFTPFINTTMLAVGEDSGRAITLTLMAVDVHAREGNARRGFSGECYSLRFSSRSNVKSDIYRFDHPFLGTFSLLVNPVNLEKGRSEAVINRIAKGQ